MVKGRELSEARRLFDEMPERDPVSWNTVLDGYVRAGDMNAAVEFFERIPDRNVVSWSTMVWGFSKAGDMDMARTLFDKMTMKNLVPWTILISGYPEKGLAQEAIGLYNQRNALVDMYANVKAGKRLSVYLMIRKREMRCLRMPCFKGWQCMDVVREQDYGVVPQIEHCGCMIDLLVHCGRLNEAFDLLRVMPMEPNAIIWGTLLGACRMHNDEELAEEVLDRLVKLEPSNPGNFSTLPNIYAAAGDGFNAASARLKMKSMGVEKPSGAGSIEVGNEVHEFTVFDDLHHESDKIYQMINGLGDDLKQEGYMPKTCYQTRSR
ncbi:Pentatricopeptide repeat [Dillenia turbinata]|uniref:Pentatricopeptide repeat n=1 Tax=Dillenia turbinata TaxID=194707 RepID=A0AAN8V7F2_9MAGN